LFPPPVQLCIGREEFVFTGESASTLQALIKARLSSWKVDHFAFEGGCNVAQRQPISAPQRGQDSETEVESRESLDEHAEEIREDAEQRFAELGEADEDRAPDDD